MRVNGVATFTISDPLAKFTPQYVYKVDTRIGSMLLAHPRDVHAPENYSGFIHTFIIRGEDSDLTDYYSIANCGSAAACIIHPQLYIPSS